MTLLSILLSITLLVLAVFSLTKYELKVKRKIKKLNKKIKKGKDVFEYERAICQAYPYIVSVFFRIKKGRRYLKELSEILSVKLPKKEEFSLPAYNNLIRTERILTKIKSEFKPNLKQVKKMTASVDKPKKRDFNLLELSNLKYLFYANGKVKLINCQESFVCDVDVFDGINELKVKDSFFFSSGTTYSLENDRVKCVIRYYPHVEGVRANVFLLSRREKVTVDLSALLCLQGQVKKLKKQVVLSPRESKSFSLDFNLYREEVLDNSILKNTDDSRIISPLRQVLEYNLNKVRFENFFYFYLSKIDRQKPVLLSDYQFYFKDYFTSPFIKEKDKRFNVIKTTYSSKENLKRYSSVLGIFNKLGYKVLLHLNCKKEDYERAKKEVKSVFWGDNNLAILSLYPLRIKEYDDLLCESKKAN